MGHLKGYFVVNGCFEICWIYEHFFIKEENFAAPDPPKTLKTVKHKITKYNKTE